MAAPALEFWFEFASTYSYLAASHIEERARRAGVSVVWRPFLLGPIFASQGWRDSPFNIYPAKGRYMWRDMERLCSAQGIPFTRPTAFPRNGLLAGRIALVAAREGWCAEFAPAVYRANFAEDRDIGTLETLADILRALGREPHAIVPRALTAENKDALKRQTDEAVRHGIFGAPSFLAAGELFWGNDRLDQAIAWSVASAR